VSVLDGKGCLTCPEKLAKEGRICTLVEGWVWHKEQDQSLQPLQIWGWQQA